MNPSPSSDWTTAQVPVLADVDLLILGGTSAAVSFALEARRLGASVYLAASRAYLGDDICAAFRFWPEEAETAPLFQTLFANHPQPPTPLHVKMTLEQALVSEEIPFLLNTFPAGLLVDESGAAAGALIANRSGRQAIRARLVVDATMEGSLLRLVDPQTVLIPSGRQSVEFATLCHEDGTDAPGLAAPVRLPGYSKGSYRLSARRYTLEADFFGDSPAEIARILNHISLQTRVPTSYRHQTALRPQRTIPAAPARWEPLVMHPGLLCLSESGTPESAARFASPGTAIADAAALAREALAHLAPAPSHRRLQILTPAGERLAGQFLSAQAGLLRRCLPGEFIEAPLDALPVLGSYEVVVVGGGTGGAPAGIAASRAGASTLIVELGSMLGGVGTSGQINCYWFGNRTGFTSEIDRSVDALAAESSRPMKEDRWIVEAKAHWYLQQATQTGCDCWFNTVTLGAWVEEGHVRGVIVAGPAGFGLVKAGCVVDATGCADIPAAAGAPTIAIGAEHVAIQGCGLAGILPGREGHNSDHSFSDDTDVVDATAFLVSSKLKYPGDFDSGELVDSRERRQIIGETTLTATDILWNRRFPDTICVATSNFDSHGFTIDPAFMIVPAESHEALWADVPLRTLIPKTLDGVLVTGLGVSAERDTLPVIRMQADVQNQGYAAGYAAALAVKKGCSIRKLDPREIQRHLVAIGNLPERILSDMESFPLPEPTLREAIASQWDQLPGVTLILRERCRTLPLLREAWRAVAGTGTAQCVRYAQLLAFMGDPCGEADLIQAIAVQPWDEGWNYRGMGQFGKTMSPLDALIIALGTAGTEAAWACLFEKMRSLPKGAEFSHYRAVAQACESLHARHPHPEAARELATLLRRPGMTGHAITSLAAAQRDANPDLIETLPRNRALCELHLARGLSRCGDPEGVARNILESYRLDLRGPFSRHAAAILAQGLPISPAAA